MSAVIDAVYRDGVFRPASLLDLPDGTAVRLSVLPPEPATPPPDGRRAFELFRVIAEMPTKPGGDPTVTGRDHDRILYGGPGGVR